MSNFPQPASSSWRQTPGAPNQNAPGFRRRQQDHSASLCPPPPPMFVQPPPMYQYSQNSFYSIPGMIPGSTHMPPTGSSPAHRHHGVSTGAQHANAVPPSGAFRCEPCQLSLESEAALQAHVQSHITCTECSFAGSRKVVKAHYQSVHGKFSGRGFKTVTIAVPGCPVQRFKICVGSHPEDVKKWIQERKRRFPRQASAQANTVVASQQIIENGDTTKTATPKEGLDTLLDGYGSSSSSDEDEKKAEALPTNISDVADRALRDESMSAASELTQRTPSYRTRPCRYFMRNGTCRNGDACTFSHDLSNVPTKPKNRSLPAKSTRGKSSSSTTLLRKLLESDARRERMLTLQLLRYLVDCNYLQEQRSKPSNSSSS